MKNGQKKIKNSIFSKVLKLFTHGMGCFGTGLGMLFHLYKGLLVTYELFEKIEKNSSKIAVFSLWGPLTEDGLENSNFQAVFFDFLKDFVSDEQTFIGAKQHPQAGPETIHIMCVKYWNFLKNQFFDFFWKIFMAPPP